MNELAVIILNYKTWSDTIKEIEHIHNLFNIDYDNFVVIDNDSPNESYEKLNSYKINKNIVLIKSDVNAGYARGNNIGLKYAYKQGYKYALIVNNDVEFTDKETLKTLVNCLEHDRKLAAINPDVCSQTGKIYNRDAIRPSFFDMTICMISYIKKGRCLEMINNNYAYVYRPQGCCMLVRLEYLNNVEYFDEATFLYNEEIILAERLLQNEYQCGCVPNCRIIHKTSSTIKNVFNKEKILKYYLFGFKYYLKEYRGFGTIKTYFALFFYFIKILIIL